MRRWRGNIWLIWNGRWAPSAALAQPNVIAAARVRVPDYQELDAVMGERFGVKRTPTPVIVQNGVGTPGLGEAVGRLLIPRGFRITLSQNAATFDHDTLSGPAASPVRVLPDVVSA